MNGIQGVERNVHFEMVAFLTRGSFLQAAIASSFTISSSILPSVDPGERSIDQGFRQLDLPSSSSQFISLTSPFDEISPRSNPVTISRGNNRINEGEGKDLAPAASFVRKEITRIVKEENPALSGSILRLAFHDATVRSLSSNPLVGGADGSIRFELEWPENRGLSNPLEVVERVYEMQKKKFQVQPSKEYDESFPRRHSSASKALRPSFPTALSFADTLALSGAAAVEASGGPHIAILLGRKDVSTADNRFLDIPIGGIPSNDEDRSRVTTSLPSAGLDSLGLRNYFGRLGLSDAELVALSGAHDLGRHVTLLGMPKSCLKNLTRVCLEDAPVMFPFVTKDPDTFSNTYFTTLLKWNKREIEYGEASFIPTDVALVVDEGLQKQVMAFSNNERLFFRTFVTAYQKLVDSTATSPSRRY